MFLPAARLVVRAGSDRELGGERGLLFVLLLREVRGLRRLKLDRGLIHRRTRDLLCLERG